MNPELLQAGLTFTAFCYLLLPVQRLLPKYRLLLLAGLLGISALPLDGLPLAGYLRGVIGDLSITTMVFLLATVLWKTFQWDRLRLGRRIQPAVFFAVLGLVLYPAALGFTHMDPYRLGFEADLLLALCGVATLVFCLTGAWLAALALILATLAYMIDFQISDNYWDYIIDPLLAVYSLGLVAQQAVRSMARTVRWMASRERRRLPAS